MAKIKTYNIMLSMTFPATHSRVGEPTHFKERLMNAVLKKQGEWQKLHTIRANYPLWQKRIEDVRAGRARIVIRRWLGKPYRSKTDIICILSHLDGVGVQRLDFPDADINSAWVDFDSEQHMRSVSTEQLSQNDGLSKADWLEWFKGYDLSKPLAIIQFTRYRY